MTFLHIIYLDNESEVENLESVSLGILSLSLSLSLSPVFLLCL